MTQVNIRPGLTHYACILEVDCGADNVYATTPRVWLSYTQAREVGKIVAQALKCPLVQYRKDGTIRSKDTFPEPLVQLSPFRGVKG